MILNIDFSLYSSPTTAYGNVVGAVETEFPIVIGAELVVLASEFGGWFSGRLRVHAIVDSDASDQLLVQLDDVVAPTLAQAEALAKSLEVAGLFVDVY